MRATHCIIPTVTFISLPLNSTPITLIASTFSQLLSLQSLQISNRKKKKLSLRIRASVNDGSGAGNWLNRFPTGAIAAEKVLKLISGATASPICQYVSSPFTFLHSVDPRIKLVIFF